jgi:NTE family protein
LQVGVDVNNSETDDVNFNARARLTLFDVGGEGNEWRSDFSIGSRTLLATEFYRPFGRSRFFAAPHAFYEDRKVNFYEDGDRLAEYSFRAAQAGIDFGYATSRSSELRVGYSIGHLKATRRIGNSLFDNLSGKTSFASLRWNYDTRNNTQIPTRGIEMRSSLNYYFDSPGATENFAQAESRINAFARSEKKTIVFGFGGGGTTFGKRAPLFQQFAVGGLFSVGGYGTGEFRGGNYLSGGFGALRETFSAPPFIGGKLYLGGWYEAEARLKISTPRNINKALLSAACSKRASDRFSSAAASPKADGAKFIFRSGDSFSFLYFNESKFQTRRSFISRSRARTIRRG